jgi:diguanylate cyclase (GGDEF)-like protein
VMVTLRAARQIDSAREAIDSLQHQTRVLEEASQRDKLTGLYNRARLDAYIAEEFAVAQRTGKPLSVIMADVDHFKRVNDTWGHAAGDQILIAVAAALGGRLRPKDLVARYGGEEFVLILPETDAPGSEVVADRIRKKIEGTQHKIGQAEPLAVTMSFGCATLAPTASFGTSAELLAAADQALYAAKRGGRNRVVIHAPVPTGPVAV